MKIHDLYLGLMAIIIVGNTLLMAYIWRSRRIPSAKAMLWTMAAVVEINLMFFILTVTPSAEVAYFTARARFLGLGFLDAFVVIWALQYTQRGTWVTPRRVVLLCIVPITTQIVLWLTPGGHSDFFKEWALIRSPDGYNVEYRLLGGFHDVYVVYTILTALICIALLVDYALRIDSSKRLTLAWIIAGTMTAGAAGIIPIVIGQAPGLRPLPIPMGLFSLAVGWAVVRHNFYAVLPLAYDLIYTSMSDAALVLDSRQRIVRANPAAERALGLSRSKMMNRKLSEVMPQASDPSLFSDSLVRFEAGGAAGAVYLGKCQPMSVGGWLMVLHDVTAQRRAQANLSRSEQRAKALVDAFPDHAMKNFRMPIQHIDAAVQALKQPSNAEQRAAHIAHIDAEADILWMMVDNVLHRLPLPADTTIAPEP